MSSSSCVMTGQCSSNTITVRTLDFCINTRWSRTDDATCQQILKPLIYVGVMGKSNLTKARQGQGSILVTIFIFHGEVHWGESIFSEKKKKVFPQVTQKGLHTLSHQATFCLRRNKFTARTRQTLFFPPLNRSWILQSDYFRMFLLD